MLRATEGRIELLKTSPVIPVVVVDDVEDAVPLARALARGGIGIIEITLRSPAAIDAIERVAAEVPEMLTGAGTITTPEQVNAVQRVGGQFLVSPGSPPRLLEAALDSGIPLLAGASSVTEMMQLLEHGLTEMKFFPAEASGGIAVLSAVYGPLPQLRFCPTGGITLQNAADYLGLPNVGCVGGSWLTPRHAVATGNWTEIERLARQSAGLVR